LLRLHCDRNFCLWQIGSTPTYFQEDFRKFLHAMIGNLPFVIPFFTSNVYPVLVAAPFIVVTFFASPYTPLRSVGKMVKGGFQRFLKKGIPWDLSFTPHLTPSWPCSSPLNRMLLRRASCLWLMVTVARAISDGNRLSIVTVTQNWLPLLRLHHTHIGLHVLS
jgi:hypothetical protein